MKKVIVSLACCALVAPLAFGKDSKNRKGTHIAVVSATRAITVTAPSPVTRMELGEVTGFQPAGVAVIHQSGAGRFVLDEPGRVINRRGEVVTTALRPGTRVQVYFSESNGSKTIDHVVVY